MDKGEADMEENTSPKPMVKDSKEKDKGYIEREDGTKIHTVDESKCYVRGDEITIKHHRWKNMDSFGRDSKSVTGKPLGKEEYDGYKRKIKFFLGGICIYTDDFGQNRMVRLQNHDLRLENKVTVSADCTICQWDDDD